MSPLRLPTSRHALVAATAAAAAVAVAAVGTVVTTPTATAAAPSVSLSTSQVPAAEDYASVAFSDPWDFDGSSDASTVPGFDTWDAGNIRYQGGELAMDVRRGGWLTLAQSVSGALPRSRDTRVQPLDASRWSRLSTRMWSSRDTTMQVYWFSCGENLPHCAGATQVPVKAGWGLYDLPVQNTTGLPQAWSGQIASMRIIPAATSDASVAFDFVRLYSPSAASRVDVTSSSSGSLLADPDRQAGNGNEVVLRSVPAGRTGVDLSALAAGAWNIGVRSGATTTYASHPVTVDPGPLPVVLQPDVAGGVSWAVSGRNGDEWDFSQPGDVLGYENVVDAQVAHGHVWGTNGGPSRNDPQVKLPLDGRTIDGDRFHRLTVRLHHEGGFGLEDGPGGGMMTRVVWQTRTDPSAYQDLEDVVISPGTDQFSVDLATDPPAAITDPSIPRRIGWAGQQITSLRVDPNEDRGARSWRIDEVRVAEDDRPSQGRFDITFEDRAGGEGTTASVYYDRDPAGFDGTRIAADLPVRPGVNTTAWSTNGLPDGRYWVYVVLDDGDQVRRAYSTGPVRVDAGQDRSSAFGAFDRTAAVPGGVEVSGWAVDPEAPQGRTQVHLYVDGRYAAVVPAHSARPDVGAAFPRWGPDHGWRTSLTGLADGPRRICAYAYTGPAGPNPALGCRTATVATDPVGNVETVRRVPGGARVGGWALDRSTDRSIDVHAWAGGAATATRADRDRPDVAAAFPGWGAAHGFSALVPLAAGTHRACLYGIDVAPGTTRLLRCLDVVVDGNPFGALDSAVRVAPSQARLRGWALDPDTAGAASVHVWQDGRLRAVVPADGRRDDVDRAFPDYGALHGFDATVPLGPGPFCVYVVNAAGAGESRLMRCTQTTG